MSASIKIENFGYTEWFNEQGKLHRIDGPSIEYQNEDEEWRLNGQLLYTDKALWKPKFRYWWFNGQGIIIY
jgi:hypothetical protein